MCNKLLYNNNFCCPAFLVLLMLFSCSVVSDSLQPHGLQHVRLFSPWDSPGKTLEWVAISFSNTLALFVESVSHSAMSDSLRCRGLYSPYNSAGQNTGVGSLSLHQGIFPPQGSNPGILHCRMILYQLSHKGSPSTPLCYVYYPCNTHLRISEGKII